MHVTGHLGAVRTASQMEILSPSACGTRDQTPRLVQSREQEWKSKLLPQATGKPEVSMKKWSRQPEIVRYWRHCGPEYEQAQGPKT